MTKRWREQSKVVLWLAAFCLLALPMLPALSAAPANAQTDSDSELPDQVVIFVIDLSGSMNEPFDSERSKLDVAKEAFVETFTNVSDNTYVGIRVYGDQLAAQSPSARKENCTTDSRLVIPISKVDREALVAEVQSFDAVGDTPIGLALRQANGDIPEGTLGTVVLFSDGRDECFDADLDGDPDVGPTWGEDPCEVAKDIAGDGVDLRIDRVETVGFRADQAAEMELRCIADSTGGSYTPIESPEDAREVLPLLLAQISSPREAERLGGEPIIGTPTQAGAPFFDRLDATGAGAGRYVDAIEMNSENWYRAPEYGPGGGTFTATAFGLPTQEGINFGMRLYLPATDQTFFESRSDSNAGVPRRPTASIRCPGCSVSGGPNDVYWIVSLSADNPDLTGTFDLELLTEGSAFGGLPTSCAQPQECWYEQQIPNRSLELSELQAQYDALVADAVSQELVDERDRLFDEVSAVEAASREASVKAESLAAEAELLGGERSTFLLPSILALVGLGLGAVGLGSRPSTGRGATLENGDDQQSTAVIGHISRDEKPTLSDQITDPSDPAFEADERPAVASDEDRSTHSALAAEAETPRDSLESREAVSPPVSPEKDEAPQQTNGTEIAPGVPEAGWYEDPEDPSRLRWWDGEAWTSQTHSEEGEES